jgi:hypothetical protein
MVISSIMREIRMKKILEKNRKSSPKSDVQFENELNKEMIPVKND